MSTRADPGPADPLGRFSAITREWFTSTFDAPTTAQAQAWNAIADGHNTLVIAPTGSGKTLAAFLWALDSLAALAQRPPGTRVLYVSPLKALAVDVERNLRTPLAGLTRIAERHRLPAPDISVGVRSGDTPPAARRQLISRPPDVLITTPESLFLMLTSAARETLAGVQTVIVDEIHAIAAGKRGAHLAVSLERLDALREDKPAQRIGLSATVRPPEELARFLSGAVPTTIVAPPSAKTVELTVQVPVPDMANLENNTIWPDVENRLVDLIESHGSTIVFANSRRLAERLTARLNEIHAERSGVELSATSAGPNPKVAGGAPAHIMGSGQTYGAEPILARAHHGSVSKEQRALVEEDLKRGTLKAVVATSSLELGIDMGAVDLVIQVEAPPSVASGLQRIGRAGHQVGEVSRGVLFPKHRTDLIGCAVSVQRMLTGQIETMRVPANPLDILAQQTVAAAALEPLDADRWFDTIRRAAPFATLPRSVYEATLDLLSGKYPSTEFAELRPRLVYDRDAGTLTARPGAQRLAVTSGGAIPDRGLFTVYLASEAEKPSRVGELEEEMVYESRPGDVISLGATSWRITEITHDRVLVIPAPGQPARLPFWRGDGVGRPAELGAALGAFTGELAALKREEFETRCAGMGFDAYATENLLRLLDEQRTAAGVVPTDTTLLVERFRDELGDWRVILHSPYGLPVNGPLALAVGRRLRERYGIDEKPTASDDGIVVRLPDMLSDTGPENPPGADLFVFDAEEVDPIVTAEVGGSALFASRFRECAARALLLPRRHPGRRSPLWQQRQRAAQLLEVARKYPDFPVVLETIRECLQDVYDVPALTLLMTGIAQRRVRVLEVETQRPSPFAASLLFGYVGAFMYEGDSPLAERRAAALSLDSTLLAELLGRVELRDLLDPEIIAATGRQLQHLSTDRAARDAEGVADLLRLLGPLTEEEVAERTDVADGKSVAGWLEGLRAARRALTVSFAGRSWWAAIEDIGRLRDGIGIAVPLGVPAAFTEEVDDPLGELLGRYARTHTPFTTAEAAARFGLGPRVTADILGRLAGDGRLVRGDFVAATEIPAAPGAGAEQWCDADVLRILRRRSLAALRAQVEPVSTAAYGRFLPAWHRIAESSRSAGHSGLDGLMSVIDQLAGVRMPASAIEPLVLAPRVRDYSPALLDELLATGEATWSGAGSISSGDGWIALHPGESAPLTLPGPPDIELADAHRAILDTLAPGGAYFFRQLTPSGFSESELKAALWELIWAGWITGDTFAPVRALLGGTRTRRRSPPAHRSHRPPRLSRYSIAHPQSRPADPTVAGRWSILPAPEPDSTVRAHYHAELLLSRHGVLTRGAVTAEGVPGGFATLYKVLSTFEDAGRCQRGYFIESLGGAQFAVASTVDRLRSYSDGVDPQRPEYRAVALAATDPANPYGAALPWPASRGEGQATAGPGARPGRKAGALVVLVDGELAWFLERGGRSLLTFTDDPAAQHAAATALGNLVSSRRVASILIERIDGAPALQPRADGTGSVDALGDAGFARTPRGMRLR
ncbi:ATP-dependent helicase [Mycobacterium sp. 94-17]|uniref:ATP-dependent helicase n=1 Tax=Mycobacterium sp. 94-17 TaxID=2986147 RepID=UPI002D1E4F26|nr:ATP-dependent helicase [Mycobacterium sp. 94-17]MEB4211555.1 ATP-dependent helicase [Mycobacterium sp. 94-17]